MVHQIPSAIEVLTKGQHKPKAEVWEDRSGRYRFEQFSLDGPVWKVRVNLTLDTVIVEDDRMVERFEVYVGSSKLPTTYRKAETAIEAAVEEAKKRRDEGTQ